MPLPQTRRGKIVAIVASALALAVILGQLLLPGLGENAIRDRLTANGGVADVSIGAFPAARLLWGNGDSLKIEASDLNLPVEPNIDPVVFKNIDRFGDVDVVLNNTTAGPFKVDSFALSRHGDGPYWLVARTSTSAAQLAAYGINGANLPGAELIGTILDFTGVGGQEIPIDLDLRMASDSGRITVVDGGGTVAGLPIGPLAELITSAIVIRL